MELEGYSEPLNLTIKKKPIAVVAPSVDSNQILNKNNNCTDNIEKSSTIPGFVPEDLSINKNINNNYLENCLDLSKYSKSNPEREMHLTMQQKNDSSFDTHKDLLYRKNIFGEQPDLVNDVYKISDSLNNKQLTSPESIYSMINSLAEQKLLAALYMNSFLAQGLPYGLGLQQPTDRGSNPFDGPNNVMLNNLLNNKNNPDNNKSTLNLASLIKNEVNDVIDKSGSKYKSNRTSVDQKNSTNDNKTQDTNNSADKKKPHIKKPLNAFMLYMKEMRAKVVAECTLKESAAINQILGRRWHSLSREEQAKYYEKARQERQLHMQLYPGWSARDNYGYGTKKKKRKKERTPVEAGGNSMKKCRARYGLDQQSQWCKPCRRKKKCIRYMESGDSGDGNQSDDNLGSCGSVGEAHTPPDDDAESLNHSLSSPGGLSGLSSLTSPSMILPSPSTSLASPSVSLASPCMSLQSPLTPHEGGGAFECKLPPSSVANVLPLPPHLHHQPHRNPVGTNPHDINNPLSVNQLTGQCVKAAPSDGPPPGGKDPARAVISVT